VIEPVCAFPKFPGTLKALARHLGRLSGAVPVRLSACALVILFLVAAVGCSRGTSVSSPASASPPTLAASALSDDDARILGQESPPPIALVDYAAFPSGADPSAPDGREYFVAPNGDDSSEDSAAGSQARPFRTIERALAVAKDGDRVLVRSGTYVSAGLDVWQSRFLLSNYRDEPVVVGAAVGARTGLSLAHPSQHDVMVRGLTLTGFSDEGVYFGNRETMRNLVLEDLEVIGSAGGMAAAYEDSVAPLVDGMLVKQVRLRDIGDIGFQFGVGPGTNVRIVGLHVQMRPQVADNSWSDGIAFEHGQNVLIENSIVEGAGSDGIDVKASAVAVVNCVVRHTGRNGVKLWSGGDVINTVVYDTGADAQLVCSTGDYRILNSVFAFHNMQGERSFTATFGLDQEQTPTTVLIANCVFYELPGRVFGFSGSTEPRLVNNFFYGYPDVFCSWGTNEYFSPSELPPAVEEENQTVDPAFVDARQGDFHPSPGSPLLGGGTTGHGAPTFDQLLQPRGGSNTVGAYQETTSEAPSSTTGTTPATTTTLHATTGTSPGGGRFLDVPADHTYRQAIEGIAGRGVIAGYAVDGGYEFRPDNPLWRAQFAKMIVGTLEIAVQEGTISPFGDLGLQNPSDLYPHDYVAAAYQAGITEGLTTSTFGPFENISRAQVVTMVVRALRRLQPGVLPDLPAGYQGSLGSFDTVHGPTLLAAQNGGLLVGMAGFGPDWDPWAPASRGEVAQLLWNVSSIMTP
jgi:hypothetical protein